MTDRNFATIPEYEELHELLTNERMGSYFNSSSGILGAFRLYEWNMSASASVMHTVGMVEVLVRNALDKSLASWSDSRHPGVDWLTLPMLDARARADITEAKRRASQRNGVATHGKIIAELSFGFWRYLVASRYLTGLWIPAAQHAFPHGASDPRRRRVLAEASLKSLNFVRNRAAHHEPIHRRDLTRDLLTSAEIAGRISPTARDWVLARSTLSEIMDARPRPETT
jgi:hypothetical protein